MPHTPKIHSLTFTGPVMNSACPWASSYEDLLVLYESAYTAGVTTRTATLTGFKENPELHQHAFTPIASLNSYGYSPHPLASYLDWAKEILGSRPSSSKPIIISITSSLPSELSGMVSSIQAMRQSLGEGAHARVGIELNTSCPNIPSKPPPSYNPTMLVPLLDILATAVRADSTLTVGIKLPPYVIPSQFEGILQALESIQLPGDSRHPISFLTCTNTLGGCLFGAEEAGMQGEDGWALPGRYGGMGGSAIHALSLGNVHRFATSLSKHSSPIMRQIAVIGVGGVSDAAGVNRMLRAGATLVECATALGRHGVGIFERLQI